MKPNQKTIELGRFWRACRYSRPQWLAVLVTVAITLPLLWVRRPHGSLQPRLRSSCRRARGC